ncbi:chromatin remodelling complex Rsc7/Swp82 subunit-domain-containing protein [Naematelia encephala]|uniref:Chromatin remodelling complex Rsc7/Swp82 subunit-domain-containing protein n=1 Tax=Naematelia encephala TaxID=71784 RepID=A0A1Y2AEU4_9TREE|nr:chromatin remodelling complex Rsc7/Swp82 subunit-domain-containing protein [Naematelia encephala]
MDSIITIKGVDYTVGDDELIIDDDPKGDTKIDALGNLLGGREYKLTTFTSPTRRSPTKVYALTIDAARACGYTDSLAFLRRCPQLLKLACNSDERHMLIEIGRVTGNLRNRMVTMVAMRNVYKLMGARVVKNGKWVTDDYYEEKSLAECVENGFTPGAVAHEDEILANALTALNPQGRPPNNTATQEITRQAANLTSFYTLGGPTTTFAGNGADPFSEHGHGHKRARLRNVGVTEEDWILRTAEESRRIDAQLKAYRAERLVELNGPDLNGWVWTAERSTEKMEGRDDLSLPKVERRRSALSHEVVLQGDEKEPEVDVDVSMHLAQEVENGDGDGKAEAGKIVVQTPEETRHASAAFNWGLGSWAPGLVKAAYEPHTNMPHVPNYTQPSTANSTRLSHFPILAAQADTQHKNFVMSSVTGRAARGLASVEYVLETSEDRMEIKDDKGLFEFTSGGPEVLERMVRDAEEWEKREREKKAAVDGV